MKYVAAIYFEILIERCPLLRVSIIRGPTVELQYIGIVLYREVSFIQSVHYKRFNCIRSCTNGVLHSD